MTLFYNPFDLETLNRCMIATYYCFRLSKYCTVYDFFVDVGNLTVCAHSTGAVAGGSSAPVRRTRPVRTVQTARARPGPPSSDGADSSATPRYTAASFCYPVTYTFFEGRLFYPSIAHKHWKHKTASEFSHSELKISHERWQQSI